MGSILQSLRHFAVPALAPVVLNVVWIATLVVASFVLDLGATASIYTVCGGILAAGVIQLGMQVVALRRLGFRPRATRQVLHPDVRKVARSMGPVVLGLAALQINVLLDGMIAVGLAGPEDGTFRLGGMALPYPMRGGANAVLYYANRLMQFPLGVFGISLATAAFPGLSSCAARQDWRGFSRSFMQGMSLLVWIAIPASVGLIVLRTPIIDLVFNHGEFQPRDVHRTAFCLLAYSTAIWAYCALHVLSRAFYSIGRHATPAKMAGATVGLNLALNLTLVWWLREAGLAAATAVCATLQVVGLSWLLSRRVDLRGWRNVAISGGRSALAAAVMAVVCLVVVGQFPRGPLSGRLGLRLARVLVPVAAGVLTYGGLSALLGAEEMRVFLRSLLRRGERRDKDA
jgi:putative peptidoglycan lipid II flippase